MMKFLQISLILAVLALSQLFAGNLDGGGHVLISVPLGDFAEVTNTGIGLGGKILYQFDSNPWFTIRTDLGYLSYESTQRPVLMDGYMVTETIRSEGFNIGIGPQATFSKGLFKAYLGATAGFYYYQTVISYPELAYYGIYASETRDSNSCFGGNIGGGVMFDIGLGPWIDIGVKYSYIKNGAVHTIDEQRIKKNAQDICISIGVVFFSSGEL